MSRYTTMTLEQLEAEEAALQCALEAVRGKVSPWRPIEEAPRDGTVLDLRASDIRWCDCFWHEDYGAWYTYQDGGHLLGVEPSHFMPLPTPPALGGV